MGREKPWWMDALDHQREALNEIVARARAYFAGDWRDLPIQPRCATLMVGPSGNGKTAVAAMATARLGAEGVAGVSMIRVSAPSWIPSGANNRGTRETIRVIAEHVATHARTILVVDECEKICDRNGDNSWMTYCRAELYDLADGRWPTGLNRPDGDADENDCPTTIPIDQLTQKLQSSVFILGIGTFQDWFDGANMRRTMGFGAEANPEKDDLSADIIAEKMPRELANRFNGTLIRLPELRADDYHRIAKEAENKLPELMREAYRAAVQRLLPGAIPAKKGVRFLEEAMMEVLKNLPPKPHPKKPEPTQEPTP